MSHTEISKQNSIRSWFGLKHCSFGLSLHIVCVCVWEIEIEPILMKEKTQITFLEVDGGVEFTSI